MLVQLGVQLPLFRPVTFTTPVTMSCVIHLQPEHYLGSFSIVVHVAHLLLKTISLHAGARGAYPCHLCRHYRHRRVSTDGIVLREMTASH
jgi:hypothetical protein